MATSLPIPAPPRTPTPPSPTPGDYQYGSDGLGIDGGTRAAPPPHLNFNRNTLSPRNEAFSPQFGSMASPMPSSAGFSASPALSESSTMGGPPPRNPFNFQTQTIKDTPVIAKSNIGQRRGHRYKHSSVSTQHQIFQEPPPRAPLALPASLPVPTFKEAWASMSSEQTRRIVWCACHALVAAYVLYSSGGSLALTALSHLIFFDAISATICVVVDVFHNFEVWKRSSVRHPFGLERAEVLAGFAMSVFLLFMGFDLISHNLKHILESVGSHTPHHPHSHALTDALAGETETVEHSHNHTHTPSATFHIDIAALSSIVATLISGLVLKNHARVSRTLRFSSLSFLPSLLSNPSHLLTLSTSFAIFLLPHLAPPRLFLNIDRVLCFSVAFCMFTLGIRLAIAQGLILLMSYSSSSIDDSAVGEVIQEIAGESNVTGVEEARFWQVHYGLCMANLKIRVRGEEGLSRLRERIGALVKNRLGEGYGGGKGGVKWEVTVQFSTDIRAGR